MTDSKPPQADETPETGPSDAYKDILARLPKEIGGPKGPEPTRFGDWEQKGRCSDF